MNNLSVKNINLHSTEPDPRAVNTHSQATFESAMGHESAAERRQKLELQRSYVENDTKKHTGIKKCRQALSRHNQDSPLLQTSLITVQNNAEFPSSAHKKPMGLSRLVKLQSRVNSRYDKAGNLPATSKGLRSLIRNGKARPRLTQVQPENQCPIIQANSTNTLEKSWAFTKAASSAPLPLMADTKAAAEAAARAIVPLTLGDHWLAQMNADNSPLAEVEPQLSELIEHLAMKIQTAFTQRGANAQFQITLPQLGIVDVNITIHAGELQIAIGSLPEVQKQLLRSHNELLERLQRLNPAQTVSLSFDNQSGFEQGSRQRRYLYEEWEHS